MDDLGYDNFDISIGREGAGYVTRVDSEAGQIKAPFTPEVLDLKNLRFLGEALIQDRGDKLFRMLFVSRVETQLRLSILRAEQAGKGLRVRLRLTEVPELAQLPWEFMYDAARNDRLSLSTRTPLVRYHELPVGVTAFAAKPPLKMLAIISSPKGWGDEFDVEDTWSKLQQAVAPLEEKGLLTLERLEAPTMRALQSRMRKGDVHILHYHGHAAFDDNKQEGVLILQDAEKKGLKVSADRLAVAIQDNRALKLMVLNACEGAVGSTDNPFVGMAQTLVQQEVPAVIAMQSKITHLAALQIANEFYRALADGLPVDMALVEGRKALYFENNQVEWGFPVLYMRVPDAHLFESTGTTPPANGGAVGGGSLRSTSSQTISPSLSLGGGSATEGLLLPEEREQLVGLLSKLPNVGTSGTAGFLLAGLPQQLILSIPPCPTPDMTLREIVNTADGGTWAQLSEDDSWSVLRVIANAIFLARGSRLEKELQALLDSLQERAIARTEPKSKRETAQTAPKPKRTDVISTARLVGKQMEALYDAFLGAFPTRQELSRLVAFRMDERLEAITQQQAVGDATYGLIQWAEANERVVDLLAAARQEKPGDLNLRAVAEELGLAPLTPPLAVVEKATTRSAVFFDVETWSAKLSETEPTVCRVETNTATQKFFGTGFLVGPNLVMTAFHVVEPVVKSIRAGEKGGDILFRFGYKMLADKTVAQGQVYRLADDWLVDSSPTDELNYALLQLEGRPGDEAIDAAPGAPPRRWLKPAKDKVLREGDALFMIQHPEGAPLKVTIRQDAVVRASADGKRITYKMDTVGGSSGAPCFDQDWELIAMHERRQQETDHGEPLKGGILMAAIAAQPKVRAALGLE